MQSLTKFDKMKMRMFPYIKQVHLVKKLQIDDESVHYISIREVAEHITHIIIKHLSNIANIKDVVVITDSTAGVGGDTISFSKNFYKVNAVEIDKKRAECLKNNIDVYNFTNVNVINDDYTKIYQTLKQNVVFIDPPWGGVFYKKKKKLRLSLSDVSIESLCKMIFENTDTTLITIKIPLNYDLQHFYKTTKCIPLVKIVYIYELLKMYILVIERVNSLG